GCNAAAVGFNGQINQIARRSSEDTQNQIRNLRDCMQDRNKPCPGRRRAFADESDADSIWPALGYRDPKSPFPVKAPVKSGPTTTWSVFGEADFDYERRTLTSGNLDLGTKTRTWTGMLGLDYSVTNINNAYDGISFGVFGRDIGSRTTDNNGNNTRQTIPGIGAYFVYSNGWFSTDVTGTASRSDLRSSAMPVETPLRIYDLQIN